MLAVIKKIMPYGAFCSLPEYGDLESFVHVSEVAPRWIKNIHEFISEGQKHVAKVLRIDRQKNQVDISLKRVNEEEKKRKLETVRTEKKAQKILEVAISGSKADITFDLAKKEISKKYEDIYDCFEMASETGEEALEGIDIPKSLKAQIVELVKKNIKKPVFEINGIIKLVSFAPDGIERVKEIIGEATKSNEKLNVHYLGAPNYKVTLDAESYKDGEKTLAAIVKKIEKMANEEDCDFSFEKI